MKLKTCQQWLCHAFHPESEPASLALFSNLIQQTNQFTATDRLKVYRHSITGNQQRVLQMLFPVSLQILGETCFDNLARDYIWSDVSNAADLNSFGETFPAWLDTELDKHSALIDYKYLVDLIRFEWLWHQCLFAADDPIFDNTHLATLFEDYGERLVPQLSNSLAFFSSKWPIYEIWYSHKHMTPQNAYTLSDTEQYYVIHFRGEILVQKVSATYFQFLNLCQQQKCLSEIATALGNMAEQGFAGLNRFVDKGWITHFTVKDSMHV